MKTKQVQKIIHVHDVLFFPPQYNRYLDRNQVRNVDAGIFQKLPKLQMLNLRGNILDSVDVDAFRDLPSLQTL